MDSRFAEKHSAEFHTLLTFLARIPAVKSNSSAWGGFGSGRLDSGEWWVKFGLDIEHPLAWSAVQELAHVLNYLSLDELLPTVFKPVSPPPYLNGGPEFLSWVIECSAGDFSPEQAAELLEGRMPTPVEDPARWPLNQKD